MYQAFTTPPYFYDDQPLSSTALKILRDNMLVLDAMAQRGFQAQRVRNIATGVGDDPHPIWRGSFQFRDGMQTAVIKLFVQAHVGETFVVKFNGVTVHSAAMANGVNTATEGIFASGYTDGEIILVDVLADYSGVDNPTQNTYIMQEAYILEAVTDVVTRAWAAPSSFGAISATNLNKLVDAQLYLYDVLSSPQMPLQISNRWTGGWWLPSETPAVLATYRFARHGNNDRLRVIVDYRSRSNISTTLHHYINGSSVDSFSFGANTGDAVTADLDISGLTIDTPARYELVEVINTPATSWRGAINTKYNIRLVETLRNAGYIAPTLPTETQMLESMTFSTLQSRLNTLGTAMTTLKSDFDSREYLLNRVYMFSRRPVTNDEQEEYLEWQYVARKKRQGNVLVVRGKDIRLGWGFEQKVDYDKPEYEFSKEETLVSGDATETKMYYLDNFDGLEIGFPYFVLGKKIEFAAEYYKY